MFLLGEVSNQVAAFGVVFREDVEEKGLDVVVQGLVVQEQLHQQAEVLAVDLVHVAVHLEHGQVVLRKKKELVMGSNFTELIDVVI